MTCNARMNAAMPPRFVHSLRVIEARTRRHEERLFVAMAGWTVRGGVAMGTGVPSSRARRDCWFGLLLDDPFSLVRDYRSCNLVAVKPVSRFRQRACTGPPARRQQ